VYPKELTLPLSAPTSNLNLLLCIARRIFLGPLITTSTLFAVLLMYAAQLRSTKMFHLLSHHTLFQILHHLFPLLCFVTLSLPHTRTDANDLCFRFSRRSWFRKPTSSSSFYVPFLTTITSTSSTPLVILISVYRYYIPRLVAFFSYLLKVVSVGLQYLMRAGLELHSLQSHHYDAAIRKVPIFADSCSFIPSLAPCARY
jgi:hypothetical protein